MRSSHPLHRVAAVFVSLCMVFSLSGLVNLTANSDEAVAETSASTYGITVDAKGEPLYEEGKINVGGTFSVAGDGQIMADLKWSYPYKNPLIEDWDNAGPDPSLPYRYRIWQAKKSDAGIWGNWEMRSPVDVDKRDGQVRVLNVAPNDTSLSYLTSWMNQKATDYDGTETTVGKGIIQVYPVTIAQYNADPEGILKKIPDGPDAGKTSTEYQYDVIMFGTYDANASQDLNAASQTATDGFYKAGGGLMFGHDTFAHNDRGVGSRTYFDKFAGPDYLNITLTPDTTMNTTTYVTVVDTGFLTSRPWNLEGRTLTVPATHMLGQRVGGEHSPGANKPRVWMQLAQNTSGTVYNERVIPGQNTATLNYYLVTNGNIAMIQTGHSNGQATVDEAKVFANTLIYLSQATTTTTARDSTFIDEAAPEKPTGALSSVSVASNGSSYTARISLRGAVDNGTDYAYRIQAVPQTHIDDASMANKYVELWSSSSTNPEAADVLRQTAKSGLKGYYVAKVDADPNPQVLTKAAMNAANIMAASSATDTVTYTTSSLNVDTQYYVHAYAVDYAGNISQDLVIPVKLTTNKLNFHYNDGTTADDVLETTLLSDNGMAASWQADPAREGYRFDGWYDTAASTGGTKLTPETRFTSLDANGNTEAYARWVKVWNVFVSQRGEGTVTIGAEGTANPFDEGSDVPVTWAPASGYHVASVWVDDEMLTSPAAGSYTLSNITSDRYITVEFEPDDAVDPSVDAANAKVTTTLRGGGASSSITPSATIAKGSSQASNYTVTWAVDSDFAVESVKVDGIERPDLIGVTSVTFPTVDRDHTVEVKAVDKGAAAGTVRVTTQLIGGPGSVTPSKAMAAGGSFDLAADVGDTKNYSIDSVKVFDATGNDVTASYGLTADSVSASGTLASISSDLRIEVRLKPKDQAGTVALGDDEMARVDTTVSGSGTISASKIVKRGEDYDVSWTAADGWRLFSVTVDGQTVYYPEEGDEVSSDPEEGDDEPDGPEEGGEEEGSETDEPEAEVASVFARVLAVMGKAFEAAPLADISGAHIGSPGHYPLVDIQSDRSVHAVFVKTDPAPPTLSNTWDDGSDPDNPVEDPAADDPFFDPDPDATHFAVITQIVGDAPATITSSNYEVPRGSNYPVSWTVPEGYQIAGVKIDGVDRPDLIGATGFTIENIDHNSLVAIKVQRIGAYEPAVEKTARNLARPEGNRVGDQVEYTITVSNKKPLTTWADASVQDALPLGLDIDPTSITLAVAGGAAQPVDPASYDAATRMLDVAIGSLAGGTSAVVTFKATINQQALTPAGSNLSNIAITRDDAGLEVPSSPAVPNEGTPAAPSAEAKAEVVKAAKNESRDTGEVKVGDRLTYSIKLTNSVAGSVFGGASIVDELPVGIEPDLDSLRLISPTGNAIPVDAGAYNAATRMLSVFAGDVFGGEVYELTFTATVTDEALDRDIANVARVTGTTTPAPEGGAPGHWGSKDPYPVEPGQGNGDYVPEDSVELVSESTPPTYPTADGEPSTEPVTVQPADPADNNGPNGDGNGDGNGPGDGAGNGNGNGNGNGGNGSGDNLLPTTGTNGGTNGSTYGNGNGAQTKLSATGDPATDAALALCVMALASMLAMAAARNALRRQ